MNPTLKLTAELASDIRARVKALDFSTIEKLAKAKEQNGTFDVIISTEVKDRAGEIVRQDGWDLTNYKNNPIVLWGHDYYSLPIGVCTETYNTTYRGVPALGARGVFFPAEVNPLAQQVRRMYEYGVKSGYNVGCTTSVGFIPKEFDPEDSSIITRSELLEFSFVPVPANQGVGPASGRSLTFEEAKELGLDVAGLRVKGLDFAETRGVVPHDVSEKKADEGTAWSKPSLKDFADESWDELSDAEKKHIAGHFAWAKEAVPETFGDLKLPHHEAKSGEVVLRGVEAAMGALMGARGGVDVDGDKKAVYEHLAHHYKQFGKEPPEFKALKEAQAGDACEMDDGSPGVLAPDPNDPDGPLVCTPAEAKAADKGSQKTLLKALAEEHERHTGEIEKAVEDFREKGYTAVGNRGDVGGPDGDEGKKAAKKPTAESQMREHLKDLRSAIADEHTMHRAKAIACFRDFKPEMEKAFDKKEHLKALRDEHDAYEAKHKAALDELDERMVKSVEGGPDTVDEHTDWITSKMEDAGRVHKKAVVKIAKAMCKSAFGEEDQADEKTVAILKDFLTPHVDPLVLTALTLKIGARISSDTKKRIAEAHSHLNAAKAVLEALHPDLADGSGEESRSDEEKSEPAPATTRSRTRTPSHDDEELKAHLLVRDTVRGIESAAREALGKINADLRSRSRK